jgi:Antidote-toxin recognition MazE, bacterial antitoxin
MRRKEAAMSKASIADKEFNATMTSKGQITLPASVRKFWDLKPGDQISAACGVTGGPFAPSGGAVFSSAWTS